MVRVVVAPWHLFGARMRAGAGFCNPFAISSSFGKPLPVIQPGTENQDNNGAVRLANYFGLRQCFLSTLFF